MAQSTLKKIYIYSDWNFPLPPVLMGILVVTVSRGKEVFAFSYDDD